ncbi:MAG: cytochrome c [Candidatus Eremiobacteraeota bacterium]|nr:cytochrome c [Candidatus Eremiobacteraeota bacterium]
MKSKPLRVAAVVASLAIPYIVACSKADRQSSSTTATGNAVRATVPAATAKGDPGRGKELFAPNCASCHGATGVEGGIGPSLKNERSRKDGAAAAAWIKNPLPPMPKLYPSPLGEKDVRDLAAYVETL